MNTDKKHRGNYDKVMADAAEIVLRMKQGRATIKSLRKEYRCGWPTLMSAILNKIPEGHLKEIRKKTIARNGINTRFKKFCLPPKHKHAGAITVRISSRGNPYRVIKISSGIIQGNHKWVPYARYLWGHINGPVPEGFFVIHADGNTLNDELCNLKLANKSSQLNYRRKSDPGFYEDARLSHSLKKLKRHKQRVRRQKLAAKNLVAEKRRHQAEIKHRRQLAAALGNIISFWQCKGCGQDYGIDPPDICPKCNGFWFEKIEYRKKAI